MAAVRKCCSDTDTMALPWSCVCAGGWVSLMFIVTINVLADSFHYNGIESQTESTQATSWVFPLKKKYLGNMIKN